MKVPVVVAILLIVVLGVIAPQPLLHAQLVKPKVDDRIRAAVGPTVPKNEYGATMAWDPLDKYWVLVGGINASQQTIVNYTWTYQAATWTNITLHSGAPVPPSYLEQFFWDPILNELVIFGGQWGVSSQGLHVFMGLTWAFSGGKWSNITGSAGLLPCLNPGQGYICSESSWGAWDNALNEGLMMAWMGTGTVGYGLTYVFTTAGKWLNESANTTGYYPRVLYGEADYDPDISDLIIAGGLNQSDIHGAVTKAALVTSAFHITYITGPPVPVIPHSVYYWGFVNFVATINTFLYAFGNFANTATASGPDYSYMMNGTSDTWVNVTSLVGSPSSRFGTTWDSNATGVIAWGGSGPGSQFADLSYPNDFQFLCFNSTIVDQWTETPCWPAPPAKHSGTNNTTTTAPGTGTFVGPLSFTLTDWEWVAFFTGLLLVGIVIIGYERRRRR